MEILGYLFVAICLIPIYRMRKTITFFFCPDEIISYRKKSIYFGLFSFLPSFFVSGLLISQIREYISNIESIKEYENIFLIIGLGLLFLLLAITGRIAETIVYFTNSEYSEWKDKRNLKDQNQNSD
ncbi:hypothetical protein [Mangrovibacterium diazotrophicum]|uniref:Uncharacterized protein n=1 Tax=Mangrovibacterium diazotrophicum TaxID=1261403 RepID=A0A419W339_9BACT|nr:hypothetical protein [Mangrovibacterium diazotrophicum]RKD89878.1 hypothetical protein BC643_0212 [Mangrovibacterium diazotrophicum]